MNLLMWVFLNYQSRGLLVNFSPGAERETKRVVVTYWSNPLVLKNETNIHPWSFGKIESSSPQHLLYRGAGYKTLLFFRSSQVAVYKASAKGLFSGFYWLYDSFDSRFVWLKDLYFMAPLKMWSKKIGSPYKRSFSRLGSLQDLTLNFHPRSSRL